MNILSWYFEKRPIDIFHLYLEYCQAFSGFFAITFLAKTLLSPWKSIRDQYPKKGFNLEAMMETLTLNVTARVIGMVIRIFAILAGLLVQALLVTIFLMYLLLWLFFPLVLLGTFLSTFTFPQ